MAEGASRNDRVEGTLLVKGPNGKELRLWHHEIRLQMYPHLISLTPQVARPSLAQDSCHTARLFLASKCPPGLRAEPRQAQQSPRCGNLSRMPQFSRQGINREAHLCLELDYVIRPMQVQADSGVHETWPKEAT